MDKDEEDCAGDGEEEEDVAVVDQVVDQVVHQVVDQPTVPLVAKQLIGAQYRS